MKKIAIIAPCILPVPATKGGAVEELITCIINQNEISKKYLIDLYTIGDSSYGELSYRFTNIIQISLAKIYSKIDRVSDKLDRTFNLNSTRSIDKFIVEKFLELNGSQEGSYYAVIVENMMSTAVELVQSTNGLRDFPVYFHMHNDVDIYRSADYIRFLTDSGVQFISISEYIKKQICKYANNAVVHLLYNGVDFNSYSMTTRTASDNIKFLYAGRVIQIKGVLELVRAFKLLLSSLDEEQRARVSLDIIGFSESISKYEKKVLKEVMNEDSIHCQTRLSTTAMAEQYNNYDVVVMPTINEEPFGLVALETIAKGIPLITTNSGALPEVVGDGALIVDKNNDFVANLVSTMKELVENPQHRISLGKKGFQMAKNNMDFDINSYYDRLVRFLDDNNADEKVSVIVPVYNVEKLLGRCVDSLINQTYKNLEIILVDDGSTDDGGKLCDGFAIKDNRIKVIHQKNQGLSGARNSGLDIAKGDYIFFVDSDDYLDLTTIEKMLYQAHRCNADVVGCGIANVFDGDESEIPFTSVKPGIWSGRESLKQMMATNNICSVAWNKLYKAYLWADVRYPVGRLHEDEATTYKILHKAQIVAFIPDCFYKYYQRNNSLMNSGLSGRYSDYILALKERIDYFKSAGDSELVQYCTLVLMEYVKYVYRNSDSREKEYLTTEYENDLKGYGIPKIFGMKKWLALLIWGVIKY